MNSHLPIIEDCSSIYVYKPSSKSHTLHYPTILPALSTHPTPRTWSNTSAIYKIMSLYPSNHWKSCWSTKKINKTITSNNHVIINKLDVLLTKGMIKAERMIKKYGPQFPWSPIRAISIIELAIWKLMKSALKTNISRDTKNTSTNSPSSQPR